MKADVCTACGMEFEQLGDDKWRVLFEGEDMMPPGKEDTDGD